MPGYGPKTLSKASDFKFLLIVSFLLIPGIAQTDDGPVNLDEVLERSERFAVQTRGCALIDGYRCLNSKEQDFLTAAAQSTMLPGGFLKAWLAALTDFSNQKDQTPAQLDLKHYKFGFTESSEHYVILFQGLLLPVIETQDGEEVVAGLLRTTYGRTTKYWITKSDFKVHSKLFYK